MSAPSIDSCFVPFQFAYTLQLRDAGCAPSRKIKTGELERLIEKAIIHRVAVVKAVQPELLKCELKRSGTDGSTEANDTWHA